ncbi:hypothetical protein E4U53_002411 [Claviceps sorghi]|nr:hypothetical protein E4U53_002411 [Claviceps sorghi]
MYPGGPNPTQIQFVPPGPANPPPLVLVHDGGGTTFSYFLLGSLGRDVWAVHNSWSLGGFLSLAMAHMLARDPAAYPIHITGLLLIDSPHHIARSRIARPVARPRLVDLPDLVRTAFANCDAMLQHWELPRWDGRRTAPGEVAAGGRRFRMRAGEVLYKPATGGAATWSVVGGVEGAEAKTEEGAGAKTEEGACAKTKDAAEAKPASLPPAPAPGPPPPAVLLRCTRPAAPSPGSAPGVPCLVDLHRADKLLGWGRYPEFIRAVIDVDADHYGLFDRTDMGRMEDVTARVAWGLAVLDGMSGAC